ncbi:MAG: prolipoprotein diacylglyceryl transferase [Actinomycetaceae bacterium]|nr:prolipoprotein diacylglyceryl transferase [Actinomycetaceae bacterium]
MIDLLPLAATYGPLPTPLPSPPVGVWYLGPIPLRAYGLLIMTGMLIGVWWTSRRYRTRGGNSDLVFDAALWAIPLGIVGARTWHVLTHLQDYFGPGLDPVSVLYIWEGGIAIMGGITGGVLGCLIAAHRSGQRLGPLADAAAPALLLAQAIGRWGNWFNQELFGAPTTLPWGLEIDDAHLPPGYPSGTLFHPTFLYESLWNLLGVIALVILDKRLKLKAGQLLGVYMMIYAVGRFFIENIRLDEAHVLLGLRINAWVAILLFVAGLALFIFLGKAGQNRNVLPEELDAKAGEGDTDSEVDLADEDEEDTEDENEGLDYAVDAEEEKDPALAKDKKDTAHVSADGGKASSAKD